MSSLEVEITRKEEFCSSHRLHNPALSDRENHELYGICNSLHGHNYAVEVTVRGPVPADTGMVLDLNRLMMILREDLISEVDHKDLNQDVPFLAGVIPTTENLAVAFWDRIQPRLRGFAGCRLQRVRVYESRSNFADYLGPAN